MRRLCRFVEGLSYAGALISAVFMALIVALILLEIVLRSVFNTSSMIGSEYSAYFLVAQVILGLAYTLRENGHIGITLVYQRVSPGAQRWLDVFAGLAAIAITAYALRYSISMVVDSYTLKMAADSVSETQLWIPQSVIPVGLTLFMLQLAAYVCRRFLPPEEESGEAREAG